MSRLHEYMLAHLVHYMSSLPFYFVPLETLKSTANETMPLLEEATLKSCFLLSNLKATEIEELYLFRHSVFVIYDGNLLKCLPKSIKKFR